MEKQKNVQGQVENPVNRGHTKLFASHFRKAFFAVNSKFDEKVVDSDGAARAKSAAAVVSSGETCKFVLSSGRCGRARAWEAHYRLGNARRKGLQPDPGHVTFCVKKDR